MCSDGCARALTQIKYIITFCLRAQRLKLRIIIPPAREARDSRIVVADYIEKSAKEREIALPLARWRSKIKSLKLEIPHGVFEARGKFACF